MNPRTLMPDPTLSLMSPNIPTLCLLDALAELHWTGRPGIAVHAPCAETKFDNRQPVSKQDYLRCLIVLDDLIAAGVIEFKSARANTFYSYILRYRKLPPAGASMKALKQAMDEDDSELPALAAPMVPVPPPVLDRDPHIMLSDDEPSEAPAIPAPPPPPLPPPAEPDPAAAEPELAPIADDIVADEPVDAAVPLPAEPH